MHPPPQSTTTCGEWGLHSYRRPLNSRLSGGHLKMIDGGAERDREKERKRQTLVWKEDEKFNSNNQLLPLGFWYSSYPRLQVLERVCEDDVEDGMRSTALFIHVGGCYGSRFVPLRHERLNVLKEKQEKYNLLSFWIHVQTGLKRNILVCKSLQLQNPAV